MSRNSLYLIVGALVVIIAVVGYMLYREQHKTGIDIQVDGKGLSVETN